MVSTHAQLIPLAAIGVCTALAGCSAPLGPIGGAHWNSALMSHCHCCCSSGGSTCDQDDPNIVPPHSNFHPLPTRPVFSPPNSIPGVYVPWPDSNPLPAAETPPPGTDVQAPRPYYESPSRVANSPVDSKTKSEPAADVASPPLLLRR
jgi:hypothetical protein